MIFRPCIFIYILFFGLSCGPSKNIPLRNNSRGAAPFFDLEGHRGCRGLMPENTIPAFMKALEIGVTTLEMDAVITADEKVILSHEPFFNHEITTKANGDQVKETEEQNLNIFKMNYAETQTYDVGLKPHPRFPEQEKMLLHKPLLADVIDSVKTWCKKHNSELPFFNIETKSKPSTDNVFHPEPARFVDLLVKVITDHKIEDRVIIQSFDFRTLQYLHKQYPAIKTSALIEDYDHLEFDGQVKKLGFVPDFYSPAWELVTAELVDQCHQKNVKLVPWTINDKPTMITLVKMGVDGIITDYPDLFKTIQ
jgi:glycerophosphoryl diester phosphodiesterase